MRRKTTRWQHETQQKCRQEGLRRRIRCAKQGKLDAQAFSFEKPVTLPKRDMDTSLDKRRSKDESMLRKPRSEERYKTERYRRRDPVVAYRIAFGSHFGGLTALRREQLFPNGIARLFRNASLPMLGTSLRAPFVSRPAWAWCKCARCLSQANNKSRSEDRLAASRIREDHGCRGPGRCECSPFGAGASTNIR